MLDRTAYCLCKRKESEVLIWKREKTNKADIDKVRHIEGFPVGKMTEDINALSPMPFIRLAQIHSLEEFLSVKMELHMMKKWNLSKRTFCSRCSEGKADPYLFGTRPITLR
jgi:hypothetical protein